MAIKTPLLPTVGNPTDFARSFETSIRGGTGLGVFIQDQTTESLRVPFLQDRGTFTLALDTIQDEYTFTASPGHGILVGEVIELANTVTFMQAKVLGVSGNIITIDTLLNHAYTAAGTTAQRSSENLLVNGSVTPQIFSIRPLAGQAGDFNAIAFRLVSAGADTMDFSTFGGRAPLTRGIVVRVKREGGDFRNLLVLKNNGELIEVSDHYGFLDPKGGNTNNGFFSVITYNGQNHNGVTVRLDGNLGEELQLVVQDNLTINNVTFKATAVGSELQEE